MMDGGCGSGNCGGSMSGNVGMPGSNCGCGQTYSTQTYSNMAPSNMPQPAPTSPAPNVISDPVTPPAPVPPSIPSPSNDGNSNGASNRHNPRPQTQMVSYEEFQRLPGTMVTGPGTPMNNHASNGVVPMPRNMASTHRMSVRPANTVAQPNVTGQTQQAVWVPAKTN